MKVTTFTFQLSLLSVLVLNSFYTWAQSDCTLITRSTDGIDSEFVTAMDADSSGNIFIAGYYNGNFSLGLVDLKRLNGRDRGNFFIAKLSQDGEVLWVNPIGGREVMSININSISPDRNGDLYVTGSAELRTVADSVIVAPNFSLHPDNDTSIQFLLKYNSVGEVLWFQDFLTFGKHDCHSIKVKSTTNDIVLSGYYKGVMNFGNYTIDPINNEALFIAKANNNGEYLWAQSIGSKIITNPEVMLNVNNTDLITISGRWEGDTLFLRDSFLVNTTPGGFGNLDRFIARFGKTGKLNWLVREGGPKKEDSGMLHSLNDGSIYALSNVEDYVMINHDEIKVTGPTMLLTKYDKDGNYVFHKSLLSSNTATSFSGSEDALFLSWTYTKPLKIGSDSLVHYNLSEAAIARLDMKGNMNWADGFSGVFEESIPHVVTLANSNVLFNLRIAGDSIKLKTENLFNSRFGSFDFFILSYTSTLSIQEYQNSIPFKIYPNPTQDYLHISPKNLLGKSEVVMVFDGFGNVVNIYTSKHGIEQRLDVRNLTSGIYFILIASEKTRYSLKFIKE